MKPLLDIIAWAVRQHLVYTDYFTYVATWNTLGNLAITPITTAIDADADFVVQQLNLVSYSSAGSKVSTPDYLLDLKDAGAGRLLSDAAVHVGNITGDVKVSGTFDLPQPKLIKAGTKITATLTNNTTTAARVDLGYCGFKLFYLSTTRRELFGI